MWLTRKLFVKDMGNGRILAMMFGQMNELPGSRMRVALIGLTQTEYFCDEKHIDVLLFIDNIFHYVQAGLEVLALLGRMPSAVDPLASNSHILDPRIVGEEHYRIAHRVQEVLQHYKELSDIIAILAMDELHEENCLNVHRAPRSAISLAAYVRGRGVYEQVCFGGEDQ